MDLPASSNNGQNSNWFTATYLCLVLQGTPIYNNSFSAYLKAYYTIRGSFE